MRHIFGVFKSCILISFFTLSLSPSLFAFDWDSASQTSYDALKSDSFHRRKRALNVLARDKSEKATNALLDALNTDRDTRIKSLAAHALSKRHEKRAIATIRSWMTHWDEDLRLTAVVALNRYNLKSITHTLVRATTDTALKVQINAIQGLKKRGGKDAFEAIIRRLDDPSSKVRIAAVEALGEIGDKRALLPLLEKLNDPTQSIRIASVKALATLNDPAIAPALLSLINDPAYEIQKTAISALGRLKYEHAVKPLIGLIQKQKQSHHAINALAQIGSEKAIAFLAKLIETNTKHHSSVKNALITYKFRHSSYILKLLHPSQPSAVKLIAIEIASECRTKGILPLLLTELSQKTLPPLTLINAIKKLKDKRAQRVLLSMLSENSFEIKRACLEALIEIVDERAAPLIRKELNNSNRIIRILAIKILRLLKSKESTMSLLKVAQGDHIDEARLAVEALAQIADHRAFKVLLSLLYHSDELLRNNAAIAISKIRWPKKHPKKHDSYMALITTCQQLSQRKEESCLMALGLSLKNNKKHSKIALNYLAKRFSLNNHSLFLAACAALAPIDSPAVEKLLSRRFYNLDKKLRPHLIEALGYQRSTLSLPILRKIINGRDDSFSTKEKAAAIYALAQRRDYRSKRKIIELTRSFKHPAIRINASAALALLSSSQDIQRLIMLANDSNQYVQSNALLGLGQLNRDKTKDIIIKQLNSPYLWARHSAIRALSIFPDREIQRGTARYKNFKTFAHDFILSEPDPRIRTLLKQLTAIGNKISFQSTNRFWVNLYLNDLQGKPLRNTYFVLIMPSGLSKVSFTDIRAQSWQYGLSQGDIYIERLNTHTPH